MLTRATIDNLPQLMQLIGEFCEIDRHEFNEQRIRECLPALLESDEHGLVWLVGKPVDGYAVITWGYSLESGGREALIDEFFLRSRQQGVGSRVLQAIIEDCLARGIRSIFLETETHNARARRFYTRAGFTADDSVWMSLPLGDETRQGAIDARLTDDTSPSQA